MENAFSFYADIFRKMEIAGIDRIGGALYSYWPVDFSAPMDKAGDTMRSIARMQRLADMAAGVAAAMCVKEGISVHDVDISALRETLIGWGVDI